MAVTSGSFYRVRVLSNRLAFEKHFVDPLGRVRPIGSGQVATPDEAANEAALAILGDHLRGDWPRAWRLVDAFEREFLSGGFTERTIDAGAVARWVERRERGD
jgi:hypothetical protein